MELRYYFQMLQRGWWLILLTALAAVSASLGASYLATPLYRSTARFIISPNASLTAGKDVVDSLDTLDRRSIVSTYAEVMNSNRIYQEVLTSLQVNASALKDYDYEAVVLPESSVLELSVSGPNPRVAAELANAIGQHTINYTTRLNQVYDVSFLDMATPSGDPYSPQPARDAALALLVGAFGGAALVILGEQIRMPLEALRQRASLDSASSAYNRRHFQRSLELALARSMPGGNVGLGLIGLQGLSDLNETLPPMLMQRLLHEVTRRLRNELRGNDIVGRWEETVFAVLLPSTPATAAERTLERIRQALSIPIILQQANETIRLEPYVGVVVSQSDETLQSVIDRAEMALTEVRNKQLRSLLGG